MRLCDKATSLTPQALSLRPALAARGGLWGEALLPRTPRARRPLLAGAAPRITTLNSLFSMYIIDRTPSGAARQPSSARAPPPLPTCAHFALFLGAAQKDPNKRPTAAKLLEHRFIKEAKKPDYIVKQLLEGLPALPDRMRMQRDGEARKGDAAQSEAASQAECALPPSSGARHTRTQRRRCRRDFASATAHTCDVSSQSVPWLSGPCYTRLRVFCTQVCKGR